MVNIWEYADADRVRITDVDGDKFEGTVAAVFDAEETCDGKDSISIYSAGKYMGFAPEEIAEIERL